MTPPSSPADTPPGSPLRSTSPVEATLIDELPESPTAAVPVRSEIATPAAADRPIRRSVALRLRYKECNGDLAGGSFVELAKTLADGLTFSDRVQFARVVTQPLLVEAEAIIGRRSFPRGGPLGRRRRGKTYREITRELQTIVVLRANGQLVEHGLFLRLTIVQVHGWLNAFLTTRPALDAVWKSKILGAPRHRRRRFPHRLDVTVEDLAALSTRSGGAGTVCVAPATGDDAPVAAAAALDDSLCSGVVVAVPAAPAVSALVGRAPESSPWFVRRRGVIIDVPEAAVAGSRAIVSLPDDGSARHATVTIAFPPGLSTGQELTVALEV